MPLPRLQNGGQNSDNSKIWKLQISCVTVTIENCIHEEVKIRSNLVNASHIQLIAFRLPVYLNNVISKLYKTLLVRFLYGRETWSFVLRIEHRLVVLRTVGGGEYVVLGGRKWQELESV